MEGETTRMAAWIREKWIQPAKFGFHIYVYNCIIVYIYIRYIYIYNYIHM
jgi:hypothetical protein